MGKIAQCVCSTGPPGGLHQAIPERRVLTLVTVDKKQATLYPTGKGVNFPFQNYSRED